jgi:hypothetical protein
MQYKVPEKNLPARAEALLQERKEGKKKGLEDTYPRFKLDCELRPKMQSKN